MTDFAPLTLVTPQEHPFAQFVRILGKGKRGARNLTREEAALRAQTSGLAPYDALMDQFDPGNRTADLKWLSRI